MYIAAICSLLYLNPFGKHMVKSAELGVSIKYIQSATDDGLSTKAIFALIGLTLKKTIREKIINLDSFIYSTVAN